MGEIWDCMRGYMHTTCRTKERLDPPFPNRVKTKPEDVQNIASHFPRTFNSGNHLEEL